MDSCDLKISSDSQKFSWIPFLRQLFICTGVWSFFFTMGLCLGATTVLIPQIRKEANSTEAVSEEMAIWLRNVFHIFYPYTAAVLGYCGIPWVFILTGTLAWIGRKRTYIIICINTFVGFILYYFCITPVHILLSELLQGAASASFLTSALIVLTEYTSSKYRGMFLTLKSATYFWGILVSNAVGTFFHWKYIPLIGMLCSSYGLLTVIIWPESPYWLASKGRLNECSAAHRWLKGLDTDSEKELTGLLTLYKSFSEKAVTKPKSLKGRLQKIFKIILQKSFYKPVLLGNLLLLLHTFSGKLVCTIYAIDIMKKITNSESAAYTSMLILDAVTVASMYLGCALSKILKRRTMLISFTSICCIILFVMSVYLYLIKLSIISENNYVSVFLLSAFSISVGSGPMILTSSISGELIPLKYRSISMCVIAVSYKVSSNLFVQISPQFFKLLGLHGTFGIFTILSSISLVLIYLYLPETKDKTLQEIADSMNGNRKPVPEATQLMPVTTSI